MKKIFLIAIVLISNGLMAQKKSLYNPAADAKQDIASIIAQTTENKKHVLIQIGGDWCSWCLKLDAFIQNNDSINAYMNANFVTYHLNYSRENKNEELLAQYRFPQRFGFPVWVILDHTGNILHTQNSAYMEAGKSYNPSVVMEVLKHWAPGALDAGNYNK